MANLAVPYLIALPGASGLPRYYWQPCRRLRAAGWRPERVPADWKSFSDAGRLEAAAVRRARAINAEVEAVRAGAPRKPVPTIRTVADLIEAYCASKYWVRLRPATRRGYGSCLRVIAAGLGLRAVVSVDAVAVQTLLERMARTPAYAVAVARVLRLLLEFARRRGLVEVNAALRPGLRSSVTRGGIIWPAEAVAAFVAVADSMGRASLGTAVLLNAWLGQRQGDVLALRWDGLHDGTLRLVQSKTGARVALPVGLVPALVDRLQAEAARQAANHGANRATLLVNEETGLAWSAVSFRRAFGQVRAALAEAAPGGFEDHMGGRVSASALTFMRLRHTAVTRLAEAECGLGEIAAVTGHTHASVAFIVERYLVRTVKMARSAFGRRLAAEAA